MKSRLIDELRDKHGLTKNDAETAAEQVLGSLLTAVERHGEVRYPGFGTMKAVTTPERNWRNPATGETVRLPAKRAVVFKPIKHNG